MLGVGWTEMLIIGVVALIVIGPKELPALMQKLGRFAGTVRRMGADFQREINKTTGLDEVRNLRQSITAPLKATTDAIRKEFNTTSSTGTVQPSGALKPADPKAQSVVAEIEKQAGIKPTPTVAEFMKEAITKATTPAATASAAPVTAAPVMTPAPIETTPAAAVAAASLTPTPLTAKRAPRLKVQPTPPVTSSELPSVEASPAMAALPVEVVPKARAPRKAKSVESPAPVEAIAPAKPKRKLAPKPTPTVEG